MLCWTLTNSMGSGTRSSATRYAKPVFNVFEACFFSILRCPSIFLVKIRCKNAYFSVHNTCPSYYSPLSPCLFGLGMFSPGNFEHSSYSSRSGAVSACLIAVRHLFLLKASSGSRRLVSKSSFILCSRSFFGRPRERFPRGSYCRAVFATSSPHFRCRVHIT